MPAESLPWAFVAFGTAFVVYAAWLEIGPRRRGAVPAAGTFEARKRRAAQLLYGLGGLGFALVGMAMLAGVFG